jgi:hypothetical protein
MKKIYYIIILSFIIILYFDNNIYYDYNTYENFSLPKLEISQDNNCGYFNNSGNKKKCPPNMFCTTLNKCVYSYGYKVNS